MTQSRCVSFVLPVYNEVDNIALFHHTLLDVMAERTDLDYEFVYINDGSRDGSLAVLREMAELDPRIKVVDFARNFGHQIAVTAGIDCAIGDAAIVMDTDLQDPPRVCLELIAKWEEGWDVAYAQRRTRKDGVFKRVTASVYYRVMRSLADIEIPLNTGDFRLMDRKIIEQLVQMREHNRFIRGMVAYIGMGQVAVPFDRDERHAGSSGYPLRAMIKFATDGIVGFSDVPLRIISRMGFLFAAVSFLGIFYAVAMKFLRPDITLQGWTFIVISILMIGGIQLITIGVLGSYVGRIYVQSQGRPLYIVRDVYQVGAADPRPDTASS